MKKKNLPHLGAREGSHGNYDFQAGEKARVGLQWRRRWLALSLMPSLHPMSTARVIAKSVGLGNWILVSPRSGEGVVISLLDEARASLMASTKAHLENWSDEPALVC